jgi:outer membrane receptor protein involved in Fe transport
MIRVLLQRLSIALAICLPLAFTTLDAQAQQTGSISGTVRDATTGEELIGVNIIVVGTTQGAATDVNGRYSIIGLRPGAYNLRVSYIGYETTLYTDIRVRAGEVTRHDIRLREAVLSTEDEIVIIGERPLIDVERAGTTVAVGREAIEAQPVRAVQDIVSAQAGVIADPTGLYIRGGRASETGFIVDGVSARDPLSGTGFGLDLGSNAFSEVEVTTGGLDVRFGDVTSGVVSVRTQEGTDQFRGFFSYKRDNFGDLNRTSTSNFMEDVIEANIGGPILPGKLRFFTSAQMQFSDGFTRQYANPSQLRTSLIDNTFWLPRTGNRWSALSKLNYIYSRSLRFEGSYQRSLTVNQNTRMLQVTGNEAVIAPGFQYAFSRQPDLANTYAHDNNLAYVKMSHVLTNRSFYEVQVSRLFTRLRADANGHPWRPSQITTELDPASIVEFPGRIFTGPDGRPIDPLALFTLPGPGFINNGGLATRWHDHFAEEITVRTNYSRLTQDNSYRLDAGFEAKFNDYQWIDVVRPWVGAPIITASGDTTLSYRLGQSADIWRVKPLRGAVYASNQFRYRGLIANVGLRFEYWAPGDYVDEMVNNPEAPILDSIREAYMNDTVGIFGRRFKLRMLPRIGFSFPVRDNQVLFFNYGHATQLPHPTFVYAGLDPFFQSRSFFADLGNPNLDPEVDISYELGLRNQITSNDVLTLSAFWRDKFDFITIEDVVIRDVTGRESLRAFRVNADFARIRGLEASYLKRVGRWFQGQVSAGYSRATGLSSTSNDAIVEFLARGNYEPVETPLAWDRPFDLKANVRISYDRDNPFLGVPGLNKFRLFVATTFRSGQRYTPVEFRGFETNPFTGDQDWRPIYERVSDPAARFSSIGEPWWWFDMSLQRDVPVVGGTNLRFTLEVKNLFDQLNSVIVNPVTGKAYPNIDPNGTDFEALRGNRDYDVVAGVRDPRYEDPFTSGLPPFNPARFLQPRHITLGLSYRF